MSKIYSQLENAQLENKSSDYSAGTIGRTWWNTTTGQSKVDDRSAIRAMLRNDQKAIIGNSGTAADNIRFHRGAAGVLQVVLGSDATAEGSLSTALNQLSFKAENYATGSLPTFGNIGRFVWDTTVGTFKGDNGTAWKEVVLTDLAQVITNKDIDGGVAANTRRITLPGATKTTLDGLTRKAGTLLYATDTKKAYLDDGTMLKPVGSGGGSGGINFLTLDSTWQPVNTDNADLEISIGNWVTFNNGATVIAQSLTSNGALGTVDSARWYGQKFIAGSSSSVNTVAFKLAKSGTASGNMVMKIYSDSAGFPGSVIGTSDPIDASTLTGTLTVTPFTFSTPPALTSGNTYHAVLDVSACTLSIGNGIQVDADSTDPYASGNEVFTLNSGSSWSSGAPNDLYFDIQSTASALTLTGGSSSLTLSRTTTGGEILDGLASIKLVKGAANTQNQGISCVGYIPLGYRGQVGSIQFPFKLLSGSLVDGDLQAVIYDVTNSQIITPINNNVTASGMMKMTFNIPATCAQIRFGLNFATASAVAATYAIDDIQVGVNEIVFGPVMTDWKEYTPTFTGLGTCTGVSFHYAQVGSLYYIQGIFTSGSPTATEARISLPNGAVIKAGQVLSILGQGGIGTGTTNDISFMGQGGDDHLKYGLYNIAASGPVNEPRDGNYAIPAATPVSLFAIVPIEGATTNVVQQNAGTFAISNYLATGTRVTATPTKLGEYRAMIRSGAGVTTGSDNAPTNSPSAANGMQIFADTVANAGTSGQPQRYEIFVGKNKYLDWQFYASAARTGYLSVDPRHSGGATVERVKGADYGYDPLTGVAFIDTLWTNDGNDTIHELGNSFSGAGTVAAVTSGYFDIFVSEQVVPVQLNTFEPVLIKEVQPNGVDPGGFLSGVWQTRILNTVENSQSWLTLASNQITLAPGRYKFKGQFPAFQVGSHQAKLYNITGSVDAIVGSANYSISSGGYVDNNSTIMGYLDIGVTTTYEVQHRCQTTKATYGVGVSDQTSTFGVDGVFGQIEIEKLR